MKERRIKRRVIAAACMAMSLLGGCLTSGGGDSTATAPPPPPPVGPSNSAPTISGTPQTEVQVSEAYSFMPSASDVDGDTLTFSIENMPRWATFNSTTGQLSGVPNLGDSGTYSQIDISVSDSELSASLAAFSVEVTQGALGSVTLSWTPPTQNEDGSILTDLAAYKFYYGTTPGNYPNSIRVDNPGIATFVIEDLSPNIYYFVATAINDAGEESRFSNMATKSLL